MGAKVNHYVMQMIINSIRIGTRNTYVIIYFMSNDRLTWSTITCILSLNLETIISRNKNEVLKI